ncbi:hypothetical protein ACJX0J_020213, partial [Zea mays]
VWLMNVLLEVLKSEDRAWGIDIGEEPFLIGQLGVETNCMSLSHFHLQKHTNHRQNHGIISYDGRWGTGRATFDILLVCLGRLIPYWTPIELLPTQRTVLSFAILLS